MRTLLTIGKNKSKLKFVKSKRIEIKFTVNLIILICNIYGNKILVNKSRVH